MWWRMSVDLSIPSASLKDGQDQAVFEFGHGVAKRGGIDLDRLAIETVHLSRYNLTHLISVNMWCCGKLQRRQ